MDGLDGLKCVTLPGGLLFGLTSTPTPVPYQHFIGQGFI